ncbi:MAG: tetratricopeptide repeat protein [Syntrophales bacterium]|nr:tetratricopeptide repeat protein [Syntrophales bacterium]
MRGRDLLAGHEYGRSLEENKKALSLSGKKPPGDEALFNMGLIYSHYGYSQKDYEKSLGLFKRLVTEYPQSRLVEQAKIWIGVLEVIEKTKQVDIEIEEKKKELSR